MLNLNLSNEELLILRKILEYDLSELRMEIADTDRMDFKENLKRQKVILNKVLEALPEADVIGPEFYLS